ncbi:hypothetical protein bcere0007_56220 [Bacillus mycoides]|nr:hypothetical protein bcere0007_56220 [Bacillus mycoides]
MYEINGFLFGYLLTLFLIKKDKRNKFGFINTSQFEITCGVFINR